MFLTSYRSDVYTLNVDTRPRVPAWAGGASLPPRSGADVQGIVPGSLFRCSAKRSELAKLCTKMFSFGCSLCRPQREQAAATAAPQPPQAPLTHPAQQMLRSKSEGRILQVETTIEPQMQRSQSMSLLEASRRRLLAAQAAAAAADAEQQLAADGSAAMQFVQQYMQAIKESNTRWGRDRAISSCLPEPPSCWAQH